MEVFDSFINWFCFLGHLGLFSLADCDLVAHLVCVVGTIHPTVEWDPASGKKMPANIQSFTFTPLEVLGPVTFTEQFLVVIKSVEKNVGSHKLKP